MGCNICFKFWRLPVYYTIHICVKSKRLPDFVLIWRRPNILSNICDKVGQLHVYYSSFVMRCESSLYLGSVSVKSPSFCICNICAEMWLIIVYYEHDMVAPCTPALCDICAVISWTGGSATPRALTRRRY